ncbi:class I SAM-dependent methyltransferase [Goekera deserti]|uniref:class I SAM-dependent methyltransferase n=1 Tax=Goekera deserti TaxID=2497753 RepID=UPI001953FCBE|nr:class I SAM-dependent methyltransferase [Goekera deserti]
MDDAEFLDPRLVAVYDAQNRWSRDDDFFSCVVGPPGARVLDLGCGTGRLTLGLAAAGHTVTGVDPAPASLAAARAKPGAEAVTWVDGTSALLPTDAFDVVVMTSHVAQFLLDDDAWAAVLADLARALVPGGRLTFDSRDPAARAWERWPTERSELVPLPDGTAVHTWTVVTGVDGGADGAVVGFDNGYRFTDGTELVSSGRLRFRTEQELRTSLAAAGFAVEELYGGWAREPVGAGDGELLVVVRRG